MLEPQVINHQAYRQEEVVQTNIRGEAHLVCPPSSLLQSIAVVAPPLTRGTHWATWEPNTTPHTRDPEGHQGILVGNRFEVKGQLLDLPTTHKT